MNWPEEMTIGIRRLKFLGFHIPHFTFHIARLSRVAPAFRDEPS